MFFSSPINRNLLQQIKGDQSVLSRVGALREVSRLAPADFLSFRRVESRLDVGFSFRMRHIESVPRYQGHVILALPLNGMSVLVDADEPGVLGH